jgi:molybdenum cofactor guanylyltransferase
VPGERPRVGGAVLAGGGSRRMGRDKAGIEVAGATLVQRARAAVAAALDPPAHGANRSGVPTPGLPAPIVAVGSPGGPSVGSWIADLRPGAGPLAGLEAALAWADTEGLEAVLLVGVDHPWLEPAVLRLLVDRLLAGGDEPGDVPHEARADAVVLGTDDGPQLLLGAYRTRVLPVVAGLLDRDERRLQALRDALHLDVVAPADWRHLDPRGATAVDVDDPAALEAARRDLGCSDGPAR